MASRARIALTQVRALEPGQIIWDTAVPGFGARRQRSALVAYVLLFRTAEGRQRWHTIGRHGAPWTPDTARAEARRLLGKVSAGEDPAADKRRKREAQTMAELCDAYLADADAGRLLTRRGGTKKASTIATDRSRIDGHIRPLLGSAKVASINRQDVERFMHSVAEGKTAKRFKIEKKHALSVVTGGRGAATRTVGLLGALFTYAVKKGLRADNPVTGTVRFADGHRDRRLSDEEYAALGKGLAEVALPQTRSDGRPSRPAMWPSATACARFLAFTGWRSGEALALRWRDVDLSKRIARLSDTKTGSSVRALSHKACEVLRTQGWGKADALVFQPSRGKNRMAGFASFFARIRSAAALPDDITPHVLRHSFASLANDLGFTEATIGMLVGHRGAGTTRDYIHGSDAVLLAAADKIAGQIAVLMNDAPQIGVLHHLRIEA